MRILFSPGLFCLFCADNHDHHSNSSSHSMPHGGAATGGATQQPSQAAQQQPSTAAAAATTMPTNITSATSSANVLSVTKKTDQEMRSDADMDEAEDPKKEVQRQNNGGRKSISAATPMGKQTTTTTTTNKKDGQQSLIEPKNEYDESNEETVEDLTLDEEEMMDDLDQAGPSHGGEGSSQGEDGTGREREIYGEDRWANRNVLICRIFPVASRQISRERCFYAGTGRSSS